ncbi:hypothetical protein MRB53_024740 [Persea americana]|uniref:Uncharacterized protein n=1 Tax=Persea americana TaxID=3435 RepID=A0ACC2LDG5_PERAE|nr:hypothetical protein MRB53_024740 [Persea americana]
MVAKSMYPDGFTYPFVLRACADLSALENGFKIHGHLIKLGLESDVHVHAALIEMYGEFHEFSGIQQVIEGMPVRGLGYWNALISGFGENGDPIDSFQLFERMRLDGIVPDSVTLVSLLQSSVDLECLKAGRLVHLLTVVIGFGGDLAVDTAVLTMYSKLGSLEMARLVFEKMPERDCAVWNIMITEYTRNGYPEKALELLVQMGKSGVRTDLFTALAAISSVVELKSLKRGKEVHAHVIRNGSNYQASVDNSLIKMYANCGSIETARKIFDFLVDKTIISWSSMIKGYVSNNCSLDALSLFSQMRKEGIEFDSVTLIRILQAFVHLGALEQVKNIHGYLIKLGYNSMTTLVTALLVSYAKCGCIEIAQKLFDEEEVDDKDIVSWNSMISAYAKHGDWHGCFKLYVHMQESKVRPDQITFVGLLTACVHSGLLKEGWECFNQMTERYGCEPNQEHYACMVDLLGRMGHLNEAMNLIRSMPFKPDVRVWGTLLSACKMHSETRLAEFAAEKLIEMEPKNAGNYVLLSNIYAAAGKWDGVAKMRSVLRDRGLKKNPGCSWLEISGQVHEFRVADRGHPKSKDIYTMLRNLELEIKADADMDSNLLC